MNENYFDVTRVILLMWEVNMNTSKDVYVFWIYMHLNWFFDDLAFIMDDEKINEYT